MPSDRISEAARLMSLARKPAQRKGREPVIRKCPWCSQPFSAREMRKHEPGCNRKKALSDAYDRSLPSITSLAR